MSICFFFFFFNSLVPLLGAIFGSGKVDKILNTVPGVRFNFVADLQRYCLAI
jgi:hypothetical protein